MEQIGQTEVCAPRSLQVWQAFMDWLSFFFHVIVQIVRGAPSLPQILSYIGFRFPLLPSSAPSFKPLPAAELPLHQFSTKKISSLSDLDDGGGQDRPLEKVTVMVVAFSSFLLYFLRKPEAKFMFEDIIKAVNTRSWLHFSLRLTDFLDSLAVLCM